MNQTWTAEQIGRRLLLSLRDTGARQTAELVRKNCAECLRQYANGRFDRKYNIDTSGIVQLADLNCKGESKQGGVWYEPTPIRTLNQIFSSLPDDLTGFTFIDFGSGKGRTILYASSYNFCRIIGVEFASELHKTAEANIRSYRNAKQKCFDITPIWVDAATFELPAENSVLYFFHPFKQEVMCRVLANIERSFRSNPRALIVMYYHPQLGGMLENLVFLQKYSARAMPFDLTAVPSPYRRRLELYASDDGIRLLKERDSRKRSGGHPHGQIGHHEIEGDVCNTQ